MNIALIALGIVCGLLGVALGVVGITLWHFINNRPFRYIYDDAQGKAVKRLEAELSELRQKNRELEMRKQKPEPPKPDAAKECGVAPPRFDEQPRRKQEQKHRKEKHKVVVVFSHGAQKYYNLEDFYQRESVRKEWISPKEGVVLPERLRLIAKNIIGHFAQRGLFAHKVCLFRNGFWHNFEACSDNRGLLTARRIEP